MAWSADLVVDGNFDNGRVLVDAAGGGIDQVNRIVHLGIPADLLIPELTPAPHNMGDCMRYWHGRISGITPGEEITIYHNQSCESNILVTLLLP